ncbi:MAG: phosphomannose isomerase type II C-terminal cupin domain [Candidatus Omnitrophota bacterium]
MEPTYKEERPWGTFEVLYEESQMKIKRIVVKPHNRLSLQSHQYRAENWVVIQGNVVATRNDEEIALATNEFIHIPKEAKHRVANEGDIDAAFIEVQIGTYLGEDDIIRYEDDYNRVTKKT